MKKLASLIACVMSISTPAFAVLDYQEVQVLVDEIAFGAGDGYFFSEYDLAGRELINGAPSTGGDSALKANSHDSSRNVSATIVECLAVNVQDKSLAVDDWVYDIIGPCDSAIISGGTLAGGYAGAPVQWYGYISNRYYSQTSANASLVTIQGQISMVDSVASVFDAADRSLNITLADTNWADIHYVINGGAQLNYRMTKSGDDYKQVIFPTIENGDTLNYYTTSQSTDGSVIESAVESLVVEGLAELVTPSYTAGTISLDSTSNLDWVDLHYSINGSSQYNYRMEGAGSNFSLNISQPLFSGDIVNFSFTYSHKGQAINSAEESVAH